MTSAPSLFSENANLRRDSIDESNTHSLVDMLYDGFYMLILLRNRKVPSDAESFSGQVLKFLDNFERTAKKHNFSAEDVFDAKYAFCAAIDETILSSRMDIRDAWERRPLQLSLFGEQLAGEHFFDRLESARNGGASRLNALEVFHMCLLLGFKGKYLLEGPEKLKYLTSQLGEQIAHIKGKQPMFAPHWEAPDRIVHALKKEIPLWVMGSVLTLLGLVAYIGLEWSAERATTKAMAPYDQIVQLTPRVPTLTITLP